MAREDLSVSMTIHTMANPTTTASSVTTDNAFTTTSTSSTTLFTPTVSTSTQVSISTTTAPETTAQDTTPLSSPTSSIPTTLSSSTTLSPSSTSITITTTTIPPTVVRSTTSLFSSSILATPSPIPSPPTNITITHAPAKSDTAVIIGISVGSSIAILLLLTIAGTWYAHIRSRTKARREEEHEIATNSQGTFIGGYNLARLKARESEQQPEILKLESNGEARVEEKPKVAGVRRSNTREDGRRNGVVLQVTNPDPAVGVLHSESHHQTFTAGEQNRARLDAWKKSKGLQHHASEAPTLYHHSEFYKSATQPPVSISLPEQQQYDTNVEIISQGVKRVRSRLDAWKTGEVEPIPEVKVTAASPILEDIEVGEGLREGKELRSFLLGGDQPVVSGPATFEAMGLREGREGLRIDKTPRSVLKE